MNNTPSWLNARALFDRSQQAEFDRQQKHHTTLNDLEQATECLYEHSLEAEVQRDKRRAKAEADSLSCSNFHVMYLSCLVIFVECIRYCRFLCICRFVICYICVLNCNVLIFTQDNKAPVRLLGVCLGEDVVVLASYTLAGPTFLLNYIKRLLWQLHKLPLSNYNPYLGSCKWQPPWLPFASALVTDW